MPIDKNSIKNLPQDEPVSVYKDKGKIYVAVYKTQVDEATGRKKRIRTIVGRVVDNTYYSMEEFHSRFKKDLSLREVPDGAVPTRRRHARLNTTLKEHGVDLSKVKNLPTGSDVRIYKTGNFIYVVERKRFKVDDKYKTQTTYLGKIINNCYYTMEQCKAMNNSRRRKQS